jgi:hypothetical protein
MYFKILKTYFILHRKFVLTQTKYETNFIFFPKIILYVFFLKSFSMPGSEGTRHGRTWYSWAYPIFLPQKLVYS